MPFPSHHPQSLYQFSTGRWWHMGAVSQKDDQDRRRDEARHFGLLKFPTTQMKRRSMRWHEPDNERQVARQIGEPSEARMKAIREGAERQDWKRVASRVAMTPRRREFVYEWVLHLATGSRIARRKL